MKIEKEVVWRVGSCRFDSEEYALKYIEGKKKENENYALNLAAIQGTGQDKAIPVEILRQGEYAEDYNKFSFLIKNKDGWEECCTGETLSYISQSATIKVLTPGAFMKGFSSCCYEIVSSTQFGKFVKEAARMNTLAGDILSTEEFAEVLSRVEIAPF